MGSEIACTCWGDGIKIDSLAKTPLQHAVMVQKGNRK